MLMRKSAPSQTHPSGGAAHAQLICSVCTHKRTVVSSLDNPIHAKLSVLCLIHFLARRSTGSMRPALKIFAASPWLAVGVWSWCKRRAPQDAVGEVLGTRTSPGWMKNIVILFAGDILACDSQELTIQTFWTPRKLRIGGLKTPVPRTENCAESCGRNANAPNISTSRLIIPHVKKTTTPAAAQLCRDCRESAWRWPRLGCRRRLSNHGLHPLIRHQPPVASVGLGHSRLSKNAAAHTRVDTKTDGLGSHTCVCKPRRIPSRHPRSM